MKLKIIALGALLCAMAGTAIANQINLVNVSEGHPFTVTYKLAYQNPDGPVTFGELRQITLTKKPDFIDIAMNHYQFSGLVIVSVAGHPLPNSVNTFNQPKKCSMTTDKKNTSGEIALDFIQYGNHHGKITCATKGGVFGL